MHFFLLEFWHTQIANIKLSFVKLIVDCDFPWMSLMELLQLLDPSASWVMAIFMIPWKIRGKSEHGCLPLTVPLL